MPAPIEPREIASRRLANQHLAGRRFTSAKELVAWMGAVQAQDYEMSKWAVGVRLDNSSARMVEAAMDRAEVIRTHVLRPTWHLVSADDVRWLILLTAPHIRSSMKARQADLELTPAILSKSRKVLEKTLRDGNYSTREELILVLNQAGIPTDLNRASHIFAAAELEGLLCSGPARGRKLTYGLLDERVPKAGPLSRDEALARLAGRYFSSHGPAGLEDFTWWSGLPAGDARRALDMVKSGLESAAAHSKTYWFIDARAEAKGAAFLLPAYDEFIISYRDRSATITPGDFQRAVSSNGIFHPVVLVHGEAIGIWKRVLKKDWAVIEIEYFTRPGKPAGKMIDHASARYGSFLDKKVELQQTLQGLR